MPAPTPAQLSVLRRAFVDVCRGYSSGRRGGSDAAQSDLTVYVRHLRHFDHVDLSSLQVQYQEEARASGAFDEAAKLKDLIAKGQWEQAREDQIAQLRDTIIRMEEGKRNVPNPSVVKTLEGQIDGEIERLNKVYSERATALGMTAEVYAQQRLNDHYILTNLFLDAKLTQPLFAESTFEDFSDSDVRAISELYARLTEPCSDANLRALSVQDFFIEYFALCGSNLNAFYGRPVVDMTFYQVRLGSYARFYRNLMETHDMNLLPREARNDPEALERHALANKNAQPMLAEGKVPTNLRPEDVQALGLKGQLSPLPKKNLGPADFAAFIAGQAAAKQG